MKACVPLLVINTPRISVLPWEDHKRSPGFELALPLTLCAWTGELTSLCRVQLDIFIHIYIGCACEGISL